MLPTYRETQRVSARHRNLEVAHLKAKMMAKDTSEKDVHPQLRTCEIPSAGATLEMSLRPKLSLSHKSENGIPDSLNTIQQASRLVFNENYAHTHTDTRTNTHTSPHLCCPAHPHSPGLSNTCCDTTPVSYIPMYGSGRPSVGTGGRCGQDAVRSPGQTFSMHHWQRWDDSHKSHSRTAHSRGNFTTHAAAEVHVSLGRGFTIYQRVPTSVLL